ncbi:MAG: (d)CMP kinase [Dehalococcoidia bacterium]|nr:(d)CMP kinase [Dehalococcoidia bacterium]
MPSERLQKLLAGPRYGSRRQTEALLIAGRVTVNGRVAALGQRADPSVDRIAVDGEPLEARAARALWMLHKPAGYVVSADDERERPTVYALLRAAPPGLRYVGRLDRDSEGLLLLTNDGELAHRLTHPRYGVPKTYEATLEGEPSVAALRALRRGIDLEDGRTAPAQIELLAPGPQARVRLRLHEGRKREVRRMLAAVGTPVVRLVRTEFGGVRLGALAPGEARPLTAGEEARLRGLVALDPAALDPAAPAFVSSSAAETPPADPVPTRAGGATIATDALARSVAIDGATAAGKSVVGRALAERLGLGFVDTGLMYRACTLAVLRAGIDPLDEQAALAVVRDMQLDMRWPEASQPHVLLNGEDVNALLRTPDIERTVSLVSRIVEVRDVLVERQRAIASRAPIVMSGRDIGTRVLTEARAKFFLEASSEVRARRRLGEELDAGRPSRFERVLEETRRRDDLDATGHRALRREQAAEDAVVVDTDALGIDEVVELCAQAYRAANGT